MNTFYRPEVGVDHATGRIIGAERRPARAWMLSWPHPPRLGVFTKPAVQRITGRRASVEPADKIEEQARAASLKNQFSGLRGPS